MKSMPEDVQHRPWPLPPGYWILAQTWHDLLFAHWSVEAAVLRPLILRALELDTFQGQTWVGVVPFRMSGVRLRAAAALPGLSAFPELNVRTYVTAGGKPGVCFFSLGAANFLAVAIARAWFHLPYFGARMSCEENRGWIRYRSERAHRGAPAARFKGDYRGIGGPFQAWAGSLEYFLERYCLYAADSRGRLLRSEIHHPP